MCAVYSETKEYDGKVKMAERLAQSAGFSIGCIGIVDCSNRCLVDAWMGRGDQESQEDREPELTETTATEIISRALKTSLSLTGENPDLRPGQNRVPADDAASTVWIHSSRYLIGIGERVGNIAAMVAFVSSQPGQMVSAEQHRMAQVGLTYADQLLHERFSPQSNQEQPKIPEIILRSLSFGFAVADAQGVLGYLTDSSRNWLSSNEELHILNGRITAKTRPNQTLIQDALVTATTGAGKTSVVQLEGVEGPLKTIVVLPINEVPRLALIVFGQEDAEDSNLRELLLETLGLTPAERRLAQQLLGGKSLAAAAKASNLTISTARSYLKAIFAKTGIHRQSELITLYHSLLPPIKTGAPPSGQQQV